MTMFLLRNSLPVLLVFLFTSMALADQSPSLWTLVPWRVEASLEAVKIDSFEFKLPARKLIASVTPSLAEIVDEVRVSKPQDRLVSRKEVVEALTRAAEGKEGPLLVVSNGSKLRIMELRPKTSISTAP